MYNATRRVFVVLMLIVVTSVTSDFDDAILDKLRRELREKAEDFLAQSGKLNRVRYIPNTANASNVSDGSSESPEATQSEETKGAARWKRSGCPGGIGNFGFNSYNLLTFALQAFNGVINTINNLNNNNNNNNINSGNNANSNFNEQSSNVNSMSMLVVVVPPAGRRKRELWEKTENGRCVQNKHDVELHRVLRDTYSTISHIIKVSEKNIHCGKYILCLSIQNSSARYGLQVLSEISRQKELWNKLLKPMLNAGDCSALFPECI